LEGGGEAWPRVGFLLLGLGDIFALVSLPASRDRPTRGHLAFNDEPPAVVPDGARPADTPSAAESPVHRHPECSLVIPVYNGTHTIGPLLREIDDAFSAERYEVILVDDGSVDDSAQTCTALVEAYPDTVRFVQLARNFGEHNAVLAGMRYARGDYVGVLDDDGQNPPSEALRLLDLIRHADHDVVYGRYRVKQHSWVRNVGSWFNDRMATLLLKKPAGLYLSSFKMMNRFVVDEVCKFHGASPYIDGLIWRTTHNIGQVEVVHRERQAGQSNYGLRKLIDLWLNSFLSFSILPLRLAGMLGLLCSLFSGVVLVAMIVDKLWFNTGVTAGVPTIIVTMALFAGVQLLILGTIGEYLGRLFLDHSGTPQFVVRSVHGKARDAGNG
jgi:glycosyltransferase involved in cell wall biosynthesis